MIVRTNRLSAYIREKVFPMKDNRIVEFKSNTDKYYEEKSGRKSNTIRRINLEEDKFRILQLWINNKDYGKIRIIHAQLPKERFIRRITNITWWMGCYLISWKHPSSNFR